MATQRRRTAPRRAKRKKQNRLRNVVLVILLFLGAAMVIVLTVPPQGFMGNIRSFLYGKLGYLSLLLPLFLFQTSAWLLDFKFRKTGFRILSGVAVTGYFFAVLLDFVISRRTLEFHNIPGGSVAGGLGDLLVPVTGAPITFLILFTAFVASLIAFTGWDIGRDFQSIADRLSAMIGRGGGRKKKKKPEESSNTESSESNAWSRDGKDQDISEISFGIRKDDRTGKKTEAMALHKKPKGARYRL
jgi:hypothetical protein